MKLSHKQITAGMAVTSLLLLGALFIWAKPCAQTMDLANGHQVPMKCLWTSRAAGLFSILLLGGALTGFFASNRQVQRTVAIWITLSSIGLMILTFAGPLGIGVCKAPAMPCARTVLWLRTGAVIEILGAVALYRMAIEKQHA